jgi:transposase
MVLGASNYTHAEASLTQGLSDFCMSVIRGLEFFGGVPELLVPDQLRSAVRGPCRYDPDTNRTFHELSVHYGTTVLPARPRKPKDKAKVETAVLIAQRWIIARIRNETFYSLGELNMRIAQLRVELNDKRFQKLDGTRRTMFESLDRPALKPLPKSRLDLGEWKKGKVHIDGHVALNERFYSAPARYIGESIEIRSTPSVVEIYADGERIASHARSYGPKGTMVTVVAHMPSAHQAMQGFSSERLIAWGATHGDAVGQAVERLLSTYPRPEFGFRAALGIIRLADRHGSAALNAVCSRALLLSKTAPRRRLLEALLKADKGDGHRPHSTRTLGLHEHIRGASYFATEEHSTKNPEKIH